MKSVENQETTKCMICSHQELTSGKNIFSTWSIFSLWKSKGTWAFLGLISWTWLSKFLKSRNKIVQSNRETFQSRNYSSGYSDFVDENQDLDWKVSPLISTAESFCYKNICKINCIFILGVNFGPLIILLLTISSIIATLFGINFCFFRSYLLLDYSS